MAIEVELKAWVDDHEGTRNRLSETATFVRKINKRDTYFSRPGLDRTLFRLRQEDKTSIVTYKRKQRTGGIEINHEHEFSVEDPLEFIGFCEYLGYSTSIEKHKTGELFVDQQTNIELTYVDELGWFVEIECLVSDESHIQTAREKIFRILSSIGIDESRIESRYYTEMLRNMKRED